MMRPVPQREDLLALRRAVADATRLQLSGLTESAVAELVAALAGGQPDDNLLRLADGAGATRCMSLSWLPRSRGAPAWSSRRPGRPS